MCESPFENAMHKIVSMIQRPDRCNVSIHLTKQKKIYEFNIQSLVEAMLHVNVNEHTKWGGSKERREESQKPKGKQKRWRKKERKKKSFNQQTEISLITYRKR